MIATNAPVAQRPPAPAHLGIDDVRAAAMRLQGITHRTPVITSRALDAQLGASLHLKAETFQRAGAFKFRGAYNAVSRLAPEVRARGVCAVSSGNHAQALALAARLHDIAATILMPADAPELKRRGAVGYGAELVEYDRYAQDREELLAQLAAGRGLHVVHPFDDLDVMAGQGTVALELVEQAGDLDVLVVPVGGGGLISGCATAAKALCPEITVVGVEPEASDDVARSLRSGRRERVAVTPTIADGQQTPQAGERTWPVIRALVDAVVTVSDAEIVTAMRTALERTKLVVEPSGATALAAVLAGRVGVTDQRVGVVLSGGNVGAEALARLLSADAP